MSITWDVYRDIEGRIIGRVATFGLPGAPVTLTSEPMSHYRNARHWAKTTKRLILSDALLYA